MNKSIRILVANRPKLMRDLVVSILAEEPDMELVGEVSEEEEIFARIQETAPDLVVIALEDPKKRPALCEVILRKNPEISVIAVAAQANRGVCYWAMVNIESEYIELSEKGFLRAVRNMSERVSAPYWRATS